MRSWCYGVVAAGSLLCSGNVDTKAIEIALRPTAVSGGAVVLLGDVAEIGGSQAEEETVQTLEQLELFPAPRQGDTRHVRQQEVRELLQLHGVDPTGLALRGAAVVRVRPPRPTPPAVPAATQQSPPQPAVPENPESWVVVARRDLARGDIVGPQDVQRLPASQLTAPLPSGIAAQIEAVVGQEVTRPIAMGRAVETTRLREPLLVRRGELVTVVARAAGVRVQTTARAQDEGALGDLVILQTLNGRERYPARVTGRQMVEVFASGVQVSSPATPAAPTAARLSQQRSQP